MTHRSPVRLLSGVAFLVLLSACAASGTGVDPAADAAAAASASTSGRSTDDSATGTTTDSGSGNQTDGGNPGAPGADPADGGGGDDGQAKGNPGGPGDEAVFEEGGGAEYSALVKDAATKCAHGVCTLKEPPIILDGHVDRVQGGVGKCTIEDKTDILYDPPAQGDRFPHGATVQAQVHCLDVETQVDEPAGDSPAGDAPAGQDPANPDAGTPAGDTTTSDTSGQPQG